MTMKVNYPEKVRNNGLTPTGKFRAEDANELKQVINNNADALTLLRLELENLNSNLSSKVSRKEIQTISNQLISLSTIIEQTAEHILLKADKSVLDNVKNTLTEHSASLEIQATQITAQVTKNEYDNLKGLIATYKTLVEQTAEAITMKAERSTVDDLTGMIEHANSKITQTADAIEHLVTKETIEALTGRVNFNESQITQTASEISSKVSSTDFNGARMISEINQTAEQVRISASKIAIEGTLTIGAFDPSTQNALGSAIASANANSVVALTNYINAILQLAVNRGLSSKTIHIQHFAETAPSVATNGDVWFKKADQSIKIWSANAWVAASTAEITLLKEVLMLASYSYDTEDFERRVFSAQPTTPYYRGDLWKPATGSLMRCNLLRLNGAYTATDWVSADKYVDDAAAQAAEANAKEYANELKEQLQEEIGQLTDALGDLGGTINTSFKDGIISDMEKVALVRQLQLIDMEKADIDQRIAILKANTYLPASNLTTLTSAATVFSSAHTNLKGAINTAISDDKITPGEATDVDVKLEAYKLTIVTLSQQMQLATNAIAQAHVASLQIGGRNLLLKTRTPLTLPASGWASYAVSQPLQTNQTYILSAKANMPASANGKIYLTKSHTVAQAKLIELNKPFVFTDTSLNGWLIAVNHSGTGTISIAQMKLEKGSKATDWTEAPEDLDGRITTLTNDLQDLLDRTSDLSTYIDEAFKDGVISLTEAQMITAYLKTMDLEKLDVDNTYNLIYHNPFLINPEKANLFAAKQGHDNAYAALVTEIQNAVFDSKISVLENQQVNAKLTLYKTALTTWATALHAANMAVIKAQNKDEVDNSARDLEQRIDGVNDKIGALPPGETIIGVIDGVAYIKTDLINANTLVVNRLRTQSGRMSINEEGLEQLRARYQNGKLAISLGVDPATNMPTLKMFDLDGRLSSEFNLAGSYKYVDPEPVWTETIFIPTGFTGATLSATEVNTIRTRLTATNQNLICRNPDYQDSRAGLYGAPYGTLGTTRAWLLSFDWPRGTTPSADQLEVLNAKGYHTTKVVSTSNFLPDGWYIQGNTYWTHNVRAIDGTPLNYAAYIYRFVGGQQVGYTVLKDLPGSSVAPVCNFITLVSEVVRGPR